MFQHGEAQHGRTRTPPAGPTRPEQPLVLVPTEMERHSAATCPPTRLSSSSTSVRVRGSLATCCTRTGRSGPTHSWSPSSRSGAIWPGNTAKPPMPQAGPTTGPRTASPCWTCSSISRTIAPFLQDTVTKMAPGARLILTVPARQYLWSSWDESLGHFRRYDKRMLMACVDGLSLHVDELSYLFPELVPFGLYRAHRHPAGTGQSRRTRRSCRACPRW